MDPEEIPITHSHPIPKKLTLYIRLTQFLSSKRAYKLALRLFFTPIHHPTPEREKPYKNSTIISRETVNGKRITVYHQGQSDRKVLLVHGWSGRATQFYKMAPAIAQAGFKVFSFTAPAHGSSEDKQTHMLEFADCIEFLENHHGPFETIIAHSIGSSASLVSIERGLKAKKIVLIGAPGHVKDIVNYFCRRLGFNSSVEQKLIQHIKEQYSEDYEEYSVARLVQETSIPGLIIHDIEDKDVDVKHARQNHQVWKNSKYIETKGLGHRLILSNDDVINQIIDFIK